MESVRLLILGVAKTVETGLIAQLLQTCGEIHKESLIRIPSASCQGCPCDVISVRFVSPADAIQAIRVLSGLVIDNSQLRFVPDPESMSLIESELAIIFDDIQSINIMNPPNKKAETRDVELAVEVGQVVTQRMHTGGLSTLTGGIVDEANKWGVSDGQIEAKDAAEAVLGSAASRVLTVAQTNSDEARAAIITAKPGASEAEIEQMMKDLLDFRQRGEIMVQEREQMFVNSVNALRKINAMLGETTKI